MSATQNEAPTVQSDDSPTETQPESQPEAETSSQESVEELPLDQTFELLKNKRRRAVLKYLRETEEDVVPIGELAEHIAAMENEIDVESVSSSQRKRAYVGLYQCHLPKMDDMNVIEFRKNRGEVLRDRNARQLEQFLEHDPGTGRPWHWYYLSLGIGGTGLLLLSQLGIVSATGTLVALVLAIFTLVTIQLLSNTSAL